MKSRQWSGIYVVLTVLLSAACFHTSGNTLKANQVPSVVLEQFRQQFTDAEDLEYELDVIDGQEYFEIEFEMTDEEFEALYNAGGRLIELEQELEAGDLPANIMDILSASYPDSEIEEAVTIQRDGKVYFEVELEVSDDNVIELMFDSEGNMIESGAIGDDESQDD